MNDVLMQADLNDLASPKLQKLKKNIGDVSQGSNILKGAFGDLKSKAEELGTPLGKIEQYFGNINPVMLGSVAIVGAVVGGLGAMTMKAIEAGASLQDMSDTTGLSVESLSSMRNVLAASNMDVKGYADAISKMSIKLGENGDYFKKLGVDIKDPDKAFDQIKHKIADIENPMQRAQLANKAFGKSFKELMPLLTMANEEYDTMKGNTNVFSAEFAKNAAKVDDNIAILKTTFSDFAVQLGANFIPMMESLVGILQDAANYWGELANGPDKQTKRSNEMDAIKAKYDPVQAESNKGSSLLGEKNHAVKIDGMTLFEALQAYQQKVRAEDKAEADSLAATKAKADANKKLADILEKQAAEADRIAKLVSANSYATYVQNRKDQDYKDTRALANDVQYGKEHDVNTNYFANGTEQRDYQGDFEKAQNQAFMMQKHKEAIANTDSFNSNTQAGNAAYDAQKFTDSLEEQTKLLEAQQQLADAIQSSLSGSFDSFFQHIRKGNQSLVKDFKELGSSIKDEMLNTAIKSGADWLAQKAATLAAEKAMWLGQLLWTEATADTARAADVAKTAATGAAEATALAPAAAMASASSWGGAAVAGGIALAAILAMAASYDVGTSYVSQDQYAKIHKGEIIIPAKESAAVRSGNLGAASRFLGTSSGGGDVYNVHVDGSSLGRKEIEEIVITSFQTLQKQNIRRRGN
jgi:hypothetical protein